MWIFLGLLSWSFILPASHFKYCFSDLRKGDGRYGNEGKMREKDEEKEGEKESKKMN